MEYLGHIVSHEGVKVDPKKIKAIKECVITQIFLEVVRRGKGSEVTTNQPSDT